MSDRKADIVRGLREMADWLEATDEAVVHSYSRVVLDFWADSGIEDGKEQILALAQSGGRFDKQYWGDYMHLRKEFGDGAVKYEMNINREQVCTKRVVGVEVVKERDPELMKAIPYVEVKREKYEWDCHPLLAGDDS